MENEKKYFAFISYKREDEEWAIWLQHEIEFYHLPASLNGRDDLPKEFRPVFRDIDELKAGNLPKQIYEALASSSNLIVICSPRAANSRWVNKEINDFIEIGKKNGVNNLERIFPFVIEGSPHANNVLQECFPITLRNLSDDKERLGGNVNESGRDKAFIKVMAGMLPSVSFDMLWNRYERDKAEEERIKREERNKLLISQSRYIAEKAIDLVEDGDSYTARLILMEVMPKSIKNMDKPITLEAESALRIAYDQHTAVLRGHTSSVYSVDFSPDGRHIGSASTDKTVRIWDVESGLILKTLEGHTDTVCSVVFSPNGKRIASASWDGKVIIWDTDTGQRIRTLEGHTGAVFSVIYSPDGKQMASASKDKTVRIWEADTGQKIRTLEGHTGAVYSIVYSPDGKQIVSSSHDSSFGDYSIKIWDVEKGQAIRTIDQKRLKTVFTFMKYSPDGSSIVSSRGRFESDDLIIWDLSKGFRRLSKKNTRFLEGHAFSVNSAVFSSDGKQIASASYDNTVKIWDVKTGKLVDTMTGHSAGVASVAFSPDNRLIASASYDSTIRIWNKESDCSVRTIDCSEAPARSATFSPDGERIFSVAKDNILRIWDAVSGQLIRTLEGPVSAIYPTSFSPDGKKIVTVCSENENMVKIWDVDSGRLVRTLETTTEYDWIVYVVYVAFLEGERVITVSSDGIMKIWDIETGLMVQTRKLCHTSLLHISFNSNRTRAASVFRSSANIIKVWDAKTGVEIVALEGHTDSITSVFFSSDGMNVVSASLDGTIRIWDIETGMEIKTIESNDRFMVNSFSPDGRYAVTTFCDKMINKMIMIWDIETGKEMRKLNGHSDTVCSVVFSPDGTHIVSTSDDGTIKIWDFPPLQDLIDQTRERFKDRPLTPEERHRYYLE